ncbi:DUF1593-domain-containing protein [Dothidotthia symphoricarpi CBS 119687]|uniref:DUF1593-domain-containing protein n=1 Tax=Dothidotthia symphoricarpi CBS 119687 TaxID=1392245 RepID=A0A6A5ZZP8_9PLEO|nr:DUF1593-domain-containing protein [Dothidotthia symphoricarpi CBS 119687]KAF2124374.1 DUF1593-domain-containing protein [Dothidotthia symphoricarpi CBS 119687]
MATEQLQTYLQKPRVFVTTAISDDTDGAGSLARYLLYSNQFETEGLVACTSTWLKDTVCPQNIEKIINAYAGAVGNLNKHVHQNWQYPSAEHLKSLVRTGAKAYGMTAISTDGELSAGGQHLYDRIIAPSTQPLWVLCWGGTNTLAEALLKIDDNYSPEDSERLLSRLRVYAASDQDNSGAWIRNNFPQIFYIVSIHGWNHYNMATWAGITGDKYYGFDQGGPDYTKMERSWIDEHIRIGSLGSAYPDHPWVPEGGTPTFLYLTQNGLGVPDCPEYGSWGGRYARTDVSSAGLNSNHHGDVVDRVKGIDGRMHTSNHATIWRWRDAFQNDFAARIKWSMEPDFAKANHHPVITVNGDSGLAPMRIDAEAGSKVTLDASGTYDPDNNSKLTFKWWHYREPTATQWCVEMEVTELKIEKLDDEGRKVEVTLPPPEKCAVELESSKPVSMGQLLHLILEATDNGSPNLTSYRRVLIQATNKELKGGA